MGRPCRDACAALNVAASAFRKRKASFGRLQSAAMALFDTSSAMKELKQKSILDIERATAITWGSRASAAFRLAARTPGEEGRHWLMDGENYRQEALEHAAMTEDLPFLKRVIAELQQDRQAALEAALRKPQMAA
jgi:hypothetical protein